MVGQLVGPFDESIGVERLDGLYDLCMQDPSPLLQEALIGHFVGERVGEGVLCLGEQARAIDELCRLEMRHVMAYGILVLASHSLEQCQRKCFAKHCSSL
jgi:hypothetical protein